MFLFSPTRPNFLQSTIDLTRAGNYHYPALDRPA